MTISPERASRTMSDLIAEEIRVALTRQRMSQRQFAIKLGVSPAWLNYRLTGVQEIGVNDLKRIADALGVGVYDLLPPPEVANRAVSEVKTGIDKRSFRPTDRKAESIRQEALALSPIGPGRTDSRRPGLPNSLSRRRPQLVRGDSRRPMTA